MRQRHGVRLRLRKPRDDKHRRRHPGDNPSDGGHIQSNRDSHGGESSCSRKPECRPVSFTAGPRPEDGCRCQRHHPDHRHYQGVGEPGHRPGKFLRLRRQPAPERKRGCGQYQSQGPPHQLQLPAGRGDVLRWRRARPLTENKRGHAGDVQPSELRLHRLGPAHQPDGHHRTLVHQLARLRRAVRRLYQERAAYGRPHRICGAAGHRPHFLLLRERRGHAGRHSPPVRGADRASGTAPLLGFGIHHFQIRIP